MIRKLRGRIDALNWADAIIDVNGVGYRLFIPFSTRQVLALHPREEPVALFVHTRLREEHIDLFGFSSEAELQVFELLIQASGVGPKLALSALSALPPERVLEALARADTDALQRIPGIGKRTAERLCVELADRARELVGGSGGGEGQVLERESARHPGFRDAVEALVSLGYSRQEALRAVRAAGRRVAVEADLEALIKAALAAAAEGR